MLNEELGSGFSAILQLLGPVFVLALSPLRFILISKSLPYPDLNFKFHSSGIYPCKLGVSPFYVNGEMCKWYFVFCGPLHLFFTKITIHVSTVSMF